MTENALYEQIAQYMNLKHTNVIYHFDLSGVWTPSHKARNLYGRLNKRAWPDLFIAKKSKIFHETATLFEEGDSYRLKQYYGLFIELKIKSPYLKDGVTLRKDEHIREQAKVLEALRMQGYEARFATGFEEAVSLIEAYLKED
jgi:hypothetical protein